MNDPITDMTNSYLNEQDRLEDEINNAPRRFFFDEDTLDEVEENLRELARAEFGTMQEAMQALQSMIQDVVIIGQYQRADGSWEAE